VASWIVTLPPVYDSLARNKAQRVVTKLENLLGADNPIIAPALSDFALHYKNQGD